MKSITKRLAVSLGSAAGIIYVILLGAAISLPIAREREQAVCRVASAILERATVIEKGHVLTVQNTKEVNELKASSHDLWYVISYETLVNEYGRDRRPPLPFALPYGGPTGFSVLYALDQRSVFCLAVMRRGDLELSMAIGGAQIPSSHIAAAFLSRSFLPIGLMALAFAAIAAIGALLAARFVGRSMERVTKLALAIDPAAPQGSIPLEEVPVELQSMAAALNRAFGEIDAYIKMQRRFLGNAAHQLRTPLTLLRAKIEDVSDPALKAELVRDVRRLTSLVAAMLDLARLQNHAIEKRPVDLTAVTRDVLADFSPSALDAGIELSLEQADGGGAVVQGVEAAIRSALSNLIGNALIHARGARRITARLSRGSVAISDDGAGLAASSEDGVAAAPFEADVPAKDGVGLGLSIVQEIMAAHGGELIVTSSPGEGTTMVLRFAEAMAEADKPASSDVQV
ncbi:MAG TPA: HAMP domain-containing sensor histidine kinase [Bradyrhizobium sp.]|nr:HAMP domain-containing sensor histidine kinase [Bradyrhizobium sp.]